MWPLREKKKKKRRSSSQSWSAYCKRKKSSIARCSLQSPSVWMGPYLGLHTQGGEVCGCLWWETSVCDMGAHQGWGRKKWASLHLLRYTAPQCLLFLLEVPHVVCAATYCQHERYIHCTLTVPRLSTLMVCVHSMSVSKSDLKGLIRLIEFVGFSSKLTFWSTSRSGSISH